MKDRSQRPEAVGPGMSQGFTWTAQREEAAQLVADDRLSDEEIAAKVGISSKQLDRWKLQCDFAARVESHVAFWREQIRRRGLAIKERRIESLIADFAATDVILTERGNQTAAGTDIEKTPYAGGARTGFITRDWKGKDADTPVYTFDAALMRERRELRKQIAQELAELPEERRLTLSLPPVTTAKDIPAALAALIAAVSSGGITSGDGQRIAGMLEVQRRTIEVVEIEQRLAVVEKSLNNKTNGNTR